MTLALLMLLACVDYRPVAPPALGASSPVVAAPVPDPGVRVDAEATVVAIGDIMMHGMVKRSAALAAVEGEAGNHAGFDVLWADTAELLRGADLAFGNLETPIAPKAATEVKEMVFNAPPAVLDALTHAGLDVLSFANNHVYDQGRAGLVETISNLDAAGVTTLGAGESCAAAQAAKIVRAGDIPIGWIGSTDLYNHDLNAEPEAPCVADFETEWILAETRRAKDAGAELVVVSVHWGREYMTVPEARHVEAARTLIDGGVDVILGHHPHVLQPIEVRPTEDGRVGVIAFSLGNFISNQVAWYVPGAHRLEVGNPRDGLALRFRVVRKDYGGGNLRTELADIEAIPLWTVNNQIHRRRGDPAVIRVQPTSLAIEQARGAAASASAAGEAEAMVSARRREAHLGDRYRGVVKIVGAGLVPAGPGAAAVR